MHDKFGVGRQILLILACTLLQCHIGTPTAIQVEFVPNVITVDEGDVASARLSIQLLLMPTSATLQSDIIVTVSVSSGSATGTVQGQGIITLPPTQRLGRLVNTTLWI